jgi:anti-sigma regulatory factor (Ser/Thr protein kinase)
MVVSEPLTLQVRNAFDAIWPAKKAAEEWLARQQISADVSFLVSLAIEELVTNCIKYEYDDSGEHTIQITLSRVDQMLTMLVVDDGHAFDPLAATPPNLDLDIEDRLIGGLGIHMLRELANNVTYERHDGTNRVTLTKRIS